MKDAIIQRQVKFIETQCQGVVQPEMVTIRVDRIESFKAEGASKTELRMMSGDVLVVLCPYVKFSQEVMG